MGLFVKDLEKVAPLLRDMEKAMKMTTQDSVWLGGKVTDHPSDVFRHHVYVAPYHEDPIGPLVEALGEDRVLFGSDYPHPEGVAEPIDFAAGLVGLTEGTVRKIMRSNAATLLGLAS